MSDKQVVTRFAPSPTGALHVGGARTALFNWAFARQHGGEFILRIEDTDVARSTKASTRGMIADLLWLGMDWDQGPRVPSDVKEAVSEAYDPYAEQVGKRGPYFQSQRGEIYDRYLAKLREAGRVYDDPAGGGALRFKMPDRDITIADLVLGDVTAKAGEKQLEDFIIYKSAEKGGGPTFHFANVVDDAEMGVTHVIRGQEHLNNTIKHLALAEAMGIESPKYAHIPLIFNPDGSKMSKRDKAKAAREGAEKTRDMSGKRFGVSEADLAAFIAKDNDELEIAVKIASVLGLDLPEIDVADFRASGYLPGVLVNYLALLGWNPGGDVEDFGADALGFLRDHFSLDRAQKGHAKFDRQKLEHFNTEAITKLEPDTFSKRLRRHLVDFHPEFAALCEDDAKFGLFAQAYQPRAHTLSEPAELGRFFVEDDEQLDYETTRDAKPVKKMLKDREQVIAVLSDLRGQFDALDDWSADAIEQVIKNYAEAHELGMGKVAQPVRVAVAGGPVSPPMGATLEILGKAKTLARLERFKKIVADLNDGD